MKKILLCILTILLLCGCEKRLCVRDALVAEYPAAEGFVTAQYEGFSATAYTAADFCEYYTEYILCNQSEAKAADWNRAFLLMSEICAVQLPSVSGQEQITLGTIEDALGGNAVDRGLMKPFPENASDIDREYIPHIPEIWDIAAYAAVALADGQVAVTDSARVAELVSGTLGEAVDMPSCVAKNNGGDCSWFVSQHGSGRNEEINCMPSVAAMAIALATGKSVSPSQLREEIKPDGGWYLFDAEAALERYNVDFERKKFSSQKILDAIDKKSIVITKCSYADADKISHCMVIYGYKRRGDAIFLMCADPDEHSVEEIPIYYAEYIISRCTSSILEVFLS